MLVKNGVILVDKFKGFTSFDTIAKLRGILSMRKIGHAGTLDPMATGVLPIFIGNATKAIQYLENHDKEYIATMRLGIKTDTQDITGKIIERNDVNTTLEEVNKAIKSFEGENKQIPPMYSAVKIDGKRLYEYAREGKVIKREPREVTFYSIEMIASNVENHTYTIKVKSSKGAYIRTLCYDIGVKLGPGATLSKLERTMACGYNISDCYTLDEIEDLVSKNNYKFLSKIETAFKTFKKVVLSENQAKMFINGIKLDRNKISNFPDVEDEILSIYDDKHVFIGLAHMEKDVLRIDRVFR